jgi:hypothetical protein
LYSELGSFNESYDHRVAETGVMPILVVARWIVELIIANFCLNQINALSEKSSHFNIQMSVDAVLNLNLKRDIKWKEAGEQQLVQVFIEEKSFLRWSKKKYYFRNNDWIFFV